MKHRVQILTGKGWDDINNSLVAGAKDPLHVWVRFYGWMKCRVVRPSGSVMREFDPVPEESRRRFHMPWVYGFRH